MLSVKEKLLLRYGQCLDEEEAGTFDLRSALSLPSAVMWAGEEDEGDEGDDSGDEGDEDDSDEEEDEEEDDDEDDEEEEPPKSKKKPRRQDPRVTRANDQAARYRVRAREQRERAEKAEAEVAKLKKGSRTKRKEDGADDKGDNEELETLKASNAKMAERLAKYEYREAIKDLAGDYKIVDTSLLRVVLEDNDIEQDEDGEWPDDIDKKLKRLIKKHPGLVAGSNGKKKSDEDEDDEDDEEGSKPPSVRGAGRGRRKTAKQARADLVKQYPALAGRR